MSVPFPIMIDEPICFRIPGVPVAKGRARISTRGGKVRSFTPPKTVAFESCVALAAEKAMAGEDPLQGPVMLTLIVALPIAQSWSAKKKNAALSNEIYPCSRPDIDNFVKIVADAGNGILWNDDAQIVTLRAFKSYSAQPCVEVEVTAL